MPTGCKRAGERREAKRALSWTGLALALFTAGCLGPEPSAESSPSPEKAAPPSNPPAAEKAAAPAQERTRQPFYGQPFAGPGLNSFVDAPLRSSAGIDWSKELPPRLEPQWLLGGPDPDLVLAVGDYTTLEIWPRKSLAHRMQTYPGSFPMFHEDGSLTAIYYSGTLLRRAIDGSVRITGIPAMPYDVGRFVVRTLAPAGKGKGYTLVYAMTHPAEHPHGGLLNPGARPYGRAVGYKEPRGLFSPLWELDLPADVRYERFPCLPDGSLLLPQQKTLRWIAPDGQARAAPPGTPYLFQPAIGLRGRVWGHEAKWGLDATDDHPSWRLVGLSPELRVLVRSPPLGKEPPVQPPLVCGDDGQAVVMKGKIVRVRQGKVAWTVSIPDDPAPLATATADGWLLVRVGPEVLAISPGGKIAWRVRTPSGKRISSNVLVASDGRLYFATEAKIYRLALRK